MKEKIPKEKRRASHAEQTPPSGGVYKNIRDMRGDDWKLLWKKFMANGPYAKHLLILIVYLLVLMVLESFRVIPFWITLVLVIPAVLVVYVMYKRVKLEEARKAEREREKRNME